MTEHRNTDSARMPALFVGHGSPMNAIEENAFSLSWRSLGQTLPRPRAILCISAHWETFGAHVTAMERPRTIHDFGGFPPELYAVQYPASGSRWLAEAVLGNRAVTPDQAWGLDHGCWSVLKNMYPEADVPVVQLSLDRNLTPREHFALGKSLSGLRDQGVLVIGSGNLVHNLRLLAFSEGQTAFGFDWALEANALFKRLIDEGAFDTLMAYETLGRAVQLAVPTPEHFLPALYVLALKTSGERIRYFNDEPWGGSLTMTSFLVE